MAVPTKNKVYGVWIKQVNKRLRLGCQINVYLILGSLVREWVNFAMIGQLHYHYAEMWCSTKARDIELNQNEHCTSFMRFEKILQICSYLNHLVYRMAYRYRLLQISGERKQIPV